ncbi:MAG TPA: YkvA family protein [Sporosarcina sp.]|nr:YkvA family protein [Sporosarcina sp.]
METEIVQRLLNKLIKYSGTIGEKTVYYSFILYYAAKSPHIPKSTKMIVVGALCYLFLPIDLIPDFIPVVGLADDSAVIAAAVYKMMSQIDDDMKARAKEKVQMVINAKK